jgi:hypothetical protein
MSQAAKVRAMDAPGPELAAPEFAPMSASRLLVIGGIALIIAGLIFGDIFAVFVLHQNGNSIGEHLLTATQAVSAGSPAAVAASFLEIGALLENRGTKVDSHVHIIDFGYLALLLMLLQPWVRLSERARKWLAAVFLIGAVLLPVGVFAIHYVGLKYSPLQAIGGASIVADLGGLFVLIATAGMGLGLWRFLRHPQTSAASHDSIREDSWASRVLLAGGSLLVLAGFLYGSWYAAFDLYRLEHNESAILSSMVDTAALGGPTAATVNSYGMLQAERAVKIAAHSHIIEFGLLAMLLAFVQPYVYLGESWRRRWIVVLLAGSLILPVFVLLELSWGLVAGGIADFGGLMVVIALTGMLAGVLRYTGRLDSNEEAT